MDVFASAFYALLDDIGSQLIVLAFIALSRRWLVMRLDSLEEKLDELPGKPAGNGDRQVPSDAACRKHTAREER